MKGIYSALVLAVSAAFLLQLVTIEAAVANGGQSSKTHNYFYGTKSSYDSLLYHDHIKLKSKFLRVQDVDATYPQKGVVPSARITYIEVLDQRSNGTGGYAYIKSGGVGQNTVTLHLKTQRNHGMDFMIFIYGHH